MLAVSRYDVAGAVWVYGANMIMLAVTALAISRIGHRDSASANVNDGQVELGVLIVSAVLSMIAAPTRPTMRCISTSSTSPRRSSSASCIELAAKSLPRKTEMNRQRCFRAAMLTVAAIAPISLAACGDDTALLPREAIVPVSVVTQYFPEVTNESGAGPNETRVGKPIASRSAVFTSDDGKKKVTLSVDKYANADEAADAYRTAVGREQGRAWVQACGVANLGDEAFAGTSQVGAEMHFGLGARDGNLIISATHAGDIPVTPDNSNDLIALAGVELTTAKQALAASKD